MARQLFPALRRKVETKTLGARVRSMATRYTVAGTPYQNNWSVDRAVREGFQTNPWVYRAVEVIAYTGISRKIVMRRGDPDNGPLITMGQDSTRLLYRLNRRPNPWETAKMFRYRLIAQFLLSSKGVYVEVTRSRAGAIAMLTLLDPDLVDIIPSANNPISAFQIRTTGDTGGHLDILPPFDPENEAQSNSVLWIRSPHPTILPAGVSPMEAVGLSIDLDRYARLYNRDYMQAGGKPGGILALKGIVDDDTVEAIEARFNHSARPGEVTALQADAMAYTDLSTAPRDMQWSEVSDRMRKEASMTFGVPESMMGDASGKTFDNADAEYAIYMEHRFAPLIGLVDDQLDVLTGGFADDDWLRHDLSDVWVLARHRRADEDRAAADFAAGIITADDVREVKGHQRLDVPASRVLWIPGGRLAVADGEPEHADDAAAAAAAPTGGTPQQGGDPGADPNADPGADPGVDPGALDAGAGAPGELSAGATDSLRQIGGVGGYGGPVGLVEQRSAPVPAPTPAAPAGVEGKQGGARARPASAGRAGPRWR